MKRWVVDAVIVAALCVLAYAAAVRMMDDAVRAPGGATYFYQDEFGPAVMAACGRGYTNARVPPDSALALFLARQRDGLACGELPAFQPRPFNVFHQLSRYLELLVAGVWRIEGIRWTGLRPLFGVLFAITAAATYGLFRLAASPWIAVPATAMVLFSPLQLGNLPNLRDYAKAPFVLVLLYLFGLLLRRPRRAATFLQISAVAGLVVGIGLGFRNDLLLMLPLFGFVALTAPIEASRPYRVRAAALGAFGLCFAAVAAPIIAAYGRGNNTPHVMLLGLTSQFDGPLGVTPAAYDLGYLYNDSYTYTRVRAFADRHGAVGALWTGTAEYDQASGQYLASLLRAVPADVLTRGIGALVSVVHAPTASLVDVSYVTGWLGKALAVRARFGSVLLVPIVTAGLLAVWLGLIERPIATATALLLSLAVASSAAIQFHPRHFFYVEPLVLWPLVFLLGALPSAFRRIALPAAGRALLLAAAPVAAAILTLMVLRSWQEARFRGRLAELRVGPSTHAVTGVTPAGDHAVRIEVAPLRPPHLIDALNLHPVVAGYYAVTFGGAACDRLSLTPTFRYSSTRSFEDFSESRTIALPLNGDPITVYFVGYDGEYVIPGGEDRPPLLLRSRFSGVEVPDVDRPCVVDIRLLDSSRAAEPLVDLVDEADIVLHQRLSWEPARRHVVPEVIAGADVSRHAVTTAVAQPLSGELAFLQPGMTRSGASFSASGVVDGPFSYMMKMGPAPVRSGRLAIASGELRGEGLTVGLLRDGGWVTSFNVRRPGPFLVAIPAPADGAYELVVANCLIGGGRRNAFTINRFGWATH